MQVNERSFSGQSIRPSPVVRCTPHTVAVVTPWNASQKDALGVISSFQESYSYLSADSDRTQPFQRMDSLSDNENSLRAVYIQVNKDIFTKHNQKEISMGFEVFFGIQTDTEFVFAQIGHPQVFFSKNKNSFQMIGQNQMMNSSQSADISYLPYNLLGLFEDVLLSVQSVKIQEGDQLILLSGHVASAEFLKFSQNSISQNSINELGKILSKNSDTESFWLGQVIF